LVFVLQLYLSTDFHVLVLVLVLEGEVLVLVLEATVLVLVLVLEIMYLLPCQRPFWVSYHLPTEERLSKLIFL